MISPANAGPAAKVGGGSNRENRNLDQNSNKSQESPTPTAPVDQFESRSAGRVESTPWHIPEPRPQPGWSGQPLLSGWHPLNLSRLQYPRELLVNPRLDLSTPFLPGMTGGFLPHMLDRFPALPVPTPIALSSSFPGLLASSQAHSLEKQKRKRSPSPDEDKISPASSNRSLKARILSRSPEDVTKESLKASPSAAESSSSPRPSLPSRSACASSSYAGGGLHPGHPAHFNHGSLIQLADGSMKRVEDLVTEDFLQSAESSPDVRIDQSTVVKLEQTVSSSNSGESVHITFSVGRARVQVTVEAALEHPFYVFDRGWASYSPELTFARYELQCRPLKVGDVCISLTHKVSSSPSSSGSPSAVLMPPPAEDSVLPAREAKYSPKQVGFNETPSIYRINTDCPPNRRETSASPPPSSSAILHPPTASSANLHPPTSSSANLQRPPSSSALLESVKTEPSDTELTEAPSDLVQPSKSSRDSVVNRS